VEIAKPPPANLVAQRRRFERFRVESDHSGDMRRKSFNGPEGRQGTQAITC
jgi:hypothetical protein